MATVDAPAQGADPTRSVTVRRLAIVGGGEHAAVVLDAARSRPDLWAVVGFSDRSREARLAGHDPSVADLGTDEDLADRVAREGGATTSLVLGVGGGTSPGDRATIVARLGNDALWAIVVHAAGIVSPSATLGEGAVVMAGAIVQAGATIGRHAIVNSGAVIEHDVVVGDFAHVGPAAAIGGGTRVGQGAFVGLGARVRDHVVIGDGATIGMGAVVVSDVPAATSVVGVPARRR